MANQHLQPRDPFCYLLRGELVISMPSVELDSEASRGKQLGDVGGLQGLFTDF